MSKHLPKTGNTKLQLATSDMSDVGEFRKASEIGHKGHGLYQLVACSRCGRERWVRVGDLKRGRGLVCRSCGYPSTEYFQHKLHDLRILGAKRASELGKPISKSRKRDPWYFKHICKVCGREVWHTKRDMNRACSVTCGRVLAAPKVSGNRHHNWKGRRYMHGDGYVVIKIHVSDPLFGMADSAGYVLEHRIVMARSIGRSLLDFEVVHHVNGDRQDNRVENLELLPNDASHLPYIILQRQVKQLRRIVNDQDNRIKLLEWHIRELEHVNPVLNSGSEPDKCVETIEEAPLNGVMR